LIGHESFDWVYNYFYGMRTDVIFEGISELDNFTTTTSLSSYQDRRAVEGYLARANYSFNDKIFVDASIRRDGSSRFGKDVRWGNFFSLGASWRLDKENFIKSANWIDELKLRAAYGQTGNENLGTSNTALYAWQDLYSIQRNANSAGFILTTNVGNSILTWEKNSNIDVAVEFAFLNRRLRGSVEFYNRVSSNLLFDVRMPLSSGVGTQNQNIGSMYNRGLEFTLSGDVVRKRDFNWNINLNANHNTNRITKMPDDTPELVSGNYRLMAGKSRYDYWLRTYVGVNPADGKVMYLFDDANTVSTDKFVYEGQTVTYNQNNAKYEYHGETFPTIFGSVTNTFKYKSLQFSFMFTYRLGGKIYNGVYNSLMSVGSYGNAKHVDILKRWQKPGDITDVPIMDNSQSTAFGAASSKWLMDGTSLAMRTATVSYTLPKNFVTNVLDLKNVNVYLSGENLFILSKMKGMNPNQSFTGAQSTSYDPARVLTLGINIAF